MASYEWLLLRVVPRTDRGEFVNAGAVVRCQAHDYLAAEVELDVDRLRALDPGIDAVQVRRHLDQVIATCAGDPAAGPVADEPPARRFAWLAAPRSTVVQPSPIHTGLTEEPARELRRLLVTLVRPPTPDG